MKAIFKSMMMLRALHFTMLCDNMFLRLYACSERFSLRRRQDVFQLEQRMAVPALMRGALIGIKVLLKDSEGRDGAKQHNHLGIDRDRSPDCFSVSNRLSVHFAAG
jgi:hypothetical protein